MNIQVPNGSRLVKEHLSKETPSHKSEVNKENIGFNSISTEGGPVHRESEKNPYKGCVVKKCDVDGISTI